ncbi:MAG: hypothetical protein Q9163_004810 [Psora crenata]
MGSLPTNSSAVASPQASPTCEARKPSDLNIHQVVLGDILFRTWYPSFYPEGLVGKEVDTLYICQWCFKYSTDVSHFLTHVRLCPHNVNGPPGRLIYLQDQHSIYRVDGEEHQLFAQNLSLFAKLFLDNKSVFFDVSCFDYYLLVRHPPSSEASTLGPQIIGFFSKEKMSWDNNNVACILIFPPWQRKGLGKILMGVSYELSRREGRYGGPERPLSELGRRGYMQFWEARIAKTVLAMKGKKMTSVSDLARECWVLSEDVAASLKEMGVLGPKRKDGSVCISKKAVREWVARTGTDLTPPICEEGQCRSRMRLPAKEGPEAPYRGTRQVCLSSQEADVHHDPTLKLMVYYGLFTTGEDSDFAVQCGDRTWKLHRLVLRNGSSYFYEACKDQRFKEATESRIELKDSEPNVVGMLLQFLYTFDYHPEVSGKGPLQTHAWVYAAADKYEVPTSRSCPG